MEVDPVMPESTEKSEGRKANQPRGKRAREASEIEAGDQPAAVKKQKRATAAKPSKDETAPDEREPDPRRSTRLSRPTKAPGPAAAEKKKRRSREEVAAAKAEADKNKQRLNALTDETDKRLMQMDIDDNNRREQEVERTILRFSDVENAASESGEEFVGFNAVSATSDEEFCDEAEDSLEEVCPCFSSFMPTMTDQCSLAHRRHTRNSRRRWQPSKQSYLRGKRGVMGRSTFVHCKTISMIDAMH